MIRRPRRDLAATQAHTELEDEAENLAFGFYLLQRRERASGESVSGADFIRALGFDDLADDLPG